MVKLQHHHYFNQSHWQNVEETHLAVLPLQTVKLPLYTMTMLVDTCWAMITSAW
jgi:hypothetical protein